MSNNKAQLITRWDNDFLRGIAICMVVTSHYALWCQAQLNNELLQYCLSKLGVYGVSIFFLLSGYVLVKNNGTDCSVGAYIGKRVKNVYLPYLLVVGMIELVSGGFQSITDILSYLTCQNYWFVCNILILYLIFLISTKLGRWFLLVVTLLTLLFSILLYLDGRAYFWYVSNMTFVFGIFVSMYEEKIKHFLKQGYVWKLLGATLLMAGAIFSGVFAKGHPYGHVTGLLMNSVATLIWAVLVVVLTAKFPQNLFPRSILGRNSYYIYLTHTFLFFQITNKWTASFIEQLLAAILITIVISAILNKVLSKGLNTLCQYLWKVREEKK